MRLANTVKIGAWVLISLNILMAFGSIWIFMRMAPAIEVIILQNELSLEACEEMLTALLRNENDKNQTTIQIESFRNALERAKNNITEKEEPEILVRISQVYENAFEKDGAGLEQTVSAILELSKINRAAMKKADIRARQLGFAGAWGVVFMAASIFLVGMIFLRSLRVNLVEPLLEINFTVTAFREGNTMRRCSLANTPKSIKLMFNNLNEVLDICCSRRKDTSQ